MLGAILTALSGMDAYSDGLQTISNNVANLNTSGFKETDVAFNELVNTSESEFLGTEDGASGYGVSVADPQTDFSQGQLQQTDNGLDLAIQGNGFLTVVDDGLTYYERTASFSVDANGYITDQNGNELTVLNADNQPVALNISSLETDAPVATTAIKFTNNLSSSGTTATISDIDVYDSQGGAHSWTVTLTNPTTDSTGTGTDWTATVTDSNGETVGTGTIDFTGGTANPASDTMTVTESVPGASDLNVTLDFSGVTSYSAGTASTISVNTVDGNAMGTLTGVSVDANGEVQIAYSNGQTHAAGDVALANFQNPQSLQLLTGGIYKNGPNNAPQYLASDAPGIGTLESSELEASNVNLSSEFGDLILIERGFQACSQVVSISNDMIQTLFGIQGQGGS
jgi:flagellar hook protein FlgE